MDPPSIAIACLPSSEPRGGPLVDRPLTWCCLGEDMFRDKNIGSLARRAFTRRGHVMWRVVPAACTVLLARFPCIHGVGFSGA